MRIVGGRLARRTIEAPKGRHTRPTTDRVREALFNLLGARVHLDGARVLDLFAGSGALGLEALSRGAAHATFVERHGPTLAVARRNAASLEVEAQAAFVRADALAFLRTPGPEADLVLADPPYDLAAIPEVPALARARLGEGGLLALEHDARHAFDDAPGCLLSRAYGRTVVSLFEA
ncbi:MAG: 16S rRNA (guanine(966)-N(2))-methyltransferase RsmD [Bacteroidota bacterium]